MKPEPQERLKHISTPPKRSQRSISTHVFRGPGIACILYGSMSTNISLTSGPKVSKWDLHWAIWRSRDMDCCKIWVCEPVTLRSCKSSGFKAALRDDEGSVFSTSCGFLRRVGFSCSFLYLYYPALINPKAPNRPKALYNVVFGPNSLKLRVLRALVQDCNSS